MRIENETRWDTRAIRSVVARVAAYELDPEVRRHLVVEVVYHRGGRTGAGSYSRPWMKLYLPKFLTEERVRKGYSFNYTLRPTLTGDVFVDTVAHECAHIRGLRHRDMKGWGGLGYRSRPEVREWARTVLVAYRGVGARPELLDDIAAAAARKETR